MDKLTMEHVRAIVRPLLTGIFAVLVALMFYQGKVIPKLLELTWLIILVEWFGERMLLKLLKR